VSDSWIDRLSMQDPLSTAIGFGGIVIGILGLFLAWFFYERQKVRHGLGWEIASQTRLLGESHELRNTSISVSECLTGLVDS
jgi:hypothetical protein